MKLQIHCPHCSAQLGVPEDAAGRAARCPRCRNTFRIPDPQSMLEDSVSCWLTDGPEDDGGVKSAPAPAPAPAPAQTPPSAPEPAAPAAPAPTERIAPQQPPKPPEPSAEEQRRERSRRIRLGAKDVYEVRSALKSGIKPSRDLEEERYAAPKPPPPPKPRTESSDSQARTDALVPMQVAAVSAAGITLAFPSRNMSRAAFRASMPMHCILCGDAEATHLSARPLGWIDKATGKSGEPEQVEAVYSVDVRAHQTPREVTDSIRTIDESNPPFNQPMPYYICRACSPKVRSVHAEAMSLPDGVRCEVRIPAPAYALRWLGRVNGVCGDDYEALEASVVAYSDERWREQDEITRQRLSAWFDFAPGEKFIEYFIDSDFARKDAGLAGVIITTARLVYCKYHAHGSIALDDSQGAVVVVPDGTFDHIAYEHDGVRRKLTRLRRADTDRLIALLREIGCRLAVKVL